MEIDPKDVRIDIKTREYLCIEITSTTQHCFGNKKCTGIPTGQSLGYPRLTIPILNIGASFWWKGKYIELVSGNNCPDADCGALGKMWNTVSIDF